MKVSLVEQMVNTYPKGMEGWRFYRIEYGGHAEDCLCEGNIWLQTIADSREVENLLNDIS